MILEHANWTESVIIKIQLRCDMDTEREVAIVGLLHGNMLQKAWAWQMHLKIHVTNSCPTKNTMILIGDFSDKNN